MLLVKQSMPAEWECSSNIYMGFKKLYDEFHLKLVTISLLLQDSGDARYLTEMQKVSCEYAFKMTIRKNIIDYGLLENPQVNSTVEQLVESACKRKELKYTSYVKEKEEFYKQLLSELSMNERKLALWALCKVYFTKAVKDLEKVHICCNVDWKTAVYFYEHEFKSADIKIDVNNWAKIAYLTTLTNKLIDKYIDTDRDVQVSTKQMLDKAHEHVNKYMGECGMDFGFKVVDIAFTGVQHN